MKTETTRHLKFRYISILTNLLQTDKSFNKSFNEKKKKKN